MGEENEDSIYVFQMFIFFFLKMQGGKTMVCLLEENEIGVWRWKKKGWTLAFEEDEIKKEKWKMEKKEDGES